MSEQIPAITKVYSRLSSLLQIGKVDGDPNLLLPSLQAHLSISLTGSKQMSNRLKKFLTPLSPGTVLDVASQLAGVLANTSELPLIPAPSTACAIFIFGLEAVALKPVPELMLISELLGSRFGGSGAGTSKWSVRDRYNILLSVIADWNNNTPWVDSTVSSKLRKAPRIEVAKTLRDSIAIRCKAYTSKLAEAFSSSDTNGRIDTQQGVELMAPTSVVPCKRSHLDTEQDSCVWEEIPPYQRRNREDSHSILRKMPPVESTKRWLQSLARAEKLLARKAAPQISRLETLQSRCNAEGRDIEDSELFEKGELEELLRTEQEVDLLRRANNWDEKSHDASIVEASLSENVSHMSQNLHQEGIETPTSNEDEVLVESWRPLSPMMLSTSFLEEDFEGW